MSIKKKWFVFIALIIFSGFFLNNSRAGLIDYERLNRIKYGKPAGASDARGGSAKEVDDFPQWLKIEPEAKSDAEKRYDVNRDGKLQSAEAKVFFREVLSQIQQKGGYTVNADILKEYDKNKDGLISRLEAEAIKLYVR